MTAGGDLTPAGTVLVAHQPAYLPWCGYFSRLLDIQDMIVLDHVQFSERGYQHRNKILTASDGARLLTVPIRRRFGQPLHDTRIADNPWARRHWRTLTCAYGRAPFWDAYAADLASLYCRPWTHLVDLDLALTRFLLGALGMKVRLRCSSELRPHGTRTAMLIDLCHRTGARTLRVGTGATSYLDPAALADAGIGAEVATYIHPPYPQQPRAPFVPALSVLDLLLRQGPRARATLAAGAATAPWPGRP